MKVRTLPKKASLIPAAGLLVLAAVFTIEHPALAQTQEACPLPPGVTPPPDPRATAQQVEDGSASLKDFAQAARDQFSQGVATAEEAFYIGCLLRHEGSPWRSGSTYLVQLTPDRIFFHAKAMALSGRLLNPVIYGAILQALGINPADLLADPGAALAAFAAAAAGDGGPFNIPDIPGASGYATVYISANFPIPIVLLAGFDLDESHLSDEEIDYGNPTVTARDVVDRETLKAFVTQAGEFFLEHQTSGDLNDSSKARIAMRDPNGPWRHGSVYLYVLDLTSNIVLFHAAFPNRFELQPLVGIARDGVTGELILPQVLEAAKSSPEGGFVEYFYDDPDDDTDSADIPKVGYARTITGELSLGGRVVPVNYIVGSGFYGRAPDVVAAGPRTVVGATVVGDAVEGLDVEFSRAVSGRPSSYDWSAVTNANGVFSLTISSADGVSGYYRARARNAVGDVVGLWHSIPLNRNQRQILELTLDGGMRVVRVEPLAAGKLAIAAEPVAAPETEVAISGLAPNSPNPFNSATVIAYHVSSPGTVKLVIYNVLGQPVRTLVNESRGAGTYQVRWDARDDEGVLLSTGVYIARLSFPGGAQTQRLLYLK